VFRGRIEYQRLRVVGSKELLVYYVFRGQILYQWPSGGRDQRNYWYIKCFRGQILYQWLRVVGSKELLVYYVFRGKILYQKLQYSNTFGGSADMDFTRPPEECTLCSFKYSHKYTIQDHIFTKRHIDNVKKFIHSQMDSERDYIDPTTLGQLVRQREIERSSQPKPWPASSAMPGEPSMAEHPHLAQLHAMGLQAMGLPAQGESLLF
jgi:hypothetical protein